MPHEILAIVPHDFALGFNLTGVDTLGCESAEEAKSVLEKELLEKQHSPILIDEDFLLSFDARFAKKIQESTLPVVMAIPLRKSFKKGVEPRDSFLRMVQDAIGYEIRIR